MPKINIPVSMDAKFLAKMANLAEGWGSETLPEVGQTFSFLTKDLIAVDNALIAYPAAYLAHCKEQKLEAIASIRKTKELVGPNGLVLDDKTSIRLSAAALALVIDQTRTDYRWEISRGNFMTLPRNTVLGLAVASVNHVQACFDTVYTHTTAVQAVALDPEAPDAYVDMEEKVATLASIDITQGWPV